MPEVKDGWTIEANHPYKVPSLSLKVGSWSFEKKNFAYLFSKLSESTFNKEISKFQKKYRFKSIRLAILPFCQGFPNSAAHTS